MQCLTLSSWESGWRRLCCWIAIGGGRGTASAPSSPSSSPQLCIPEDDDFESVPLLSPSFRPLCGEKNINTNKHRFIKAILAIVIINESREGFIIELVMVSVQYNSSSVLHSISEIQFHWPTGPHFKSKAQHVGCMPKMNLW